MSVRLVPVDWLDKFEECKDEEAEFLAVLTLILSAILGVLVNVFTGDVNLGRHFWAFVLTLGLGALYFTRRYFKSRGQVKKLKAQMSAAFSIAADDRIAGGPALPSSKTEID